MQLTESLIRVKTRYNSQFQRISRRYLPIIAIFPPWAFMVAICLARQYTLENNTSDCKLGENHARARQLVILRDLRGLTPPFWIRWECYQGRPCLGCIVAYYRLPIHLAARYVKVPPLVLIFYIYSHQQFCRKSRHSIVFLPLHAKHRRSHITYF